MTDEHLLGALQPPPESVESLAQHFLGRETPSLFLPLDAHFLSNFTSQYPEGVANAIREARQVCQHQFTLPGGEMEYFGEKIDWHWDAKSGQRWNSRVYFKLGSQDARAGEDILVPWWLSSFYHLIPLGKVYCLGRLKAGGVTTKEAETSAREFCAEIEAWILENPYPFGINWQSTTIVSLRLIHWLWAYLLFRDCPAIPNRFWIEFFKQILRHGRHIRENLEWFPIRTNHYLANVAALFYVGVLLPEFSEAKEWLDFSHTELIREIEHHTYSDGALHEGSLNYHRFVTEILLASTILGQAHKLLFPNVYLTRLEKMVDFILHSLRPDRTLPKVGDAADIRLQHLDNRDVTADPRHLLALGAVLFKRADFKKAAGAFPEYAYWLLGDEGKRQYDTIPEIQELPGSKSFPASGFHIIREEKFYMFIRCGRLALNGLASHGHHDQLAFELWVHGVPVLVDPGWYVYEADPEMFRYFKSTRAHNTVTVDGRDQVASNLFIYPPPTRPIPRLLEWRTDDGSTMFSGEHALYSDLPDAVAHRRMVRYVYGNRMILIEDLLEGAGIHQLEWNFHFAPGFSVTHDPRGVVFKGSAVEGRLDCEGLNGSQKVVEEGWVAPRYGKKLRAPVVRWRWKGQLPLRGRFTLRVSPVLTQ